MQEATICMVGAYVPPIPEELRGAPPAWQEDTNPELDALMDKLTAVPGDRKLLPPENYYDWQIDDVLAAYREQIALILEREYERIGMLYWSPCVTIRDIQLLREQCNILLVVDAENSRRVQDALWESIARNARLAAMLMQWEPPDDEVIGILREMNSHGLRVQHHRLTEQILSPFDIREKSGRLLKAAFPGE